MLRTLFVLLLFFVVSDIAIGQHFASGIKIGEVDQSSAIVWVRLTKGAKANFDLLQPKLKNPMTTDVVKGQQGDFQLKLLREIPSQGWRSVKIYDSLSVDAEKDFTCQVSLDGLRPNTLSLIHI